MSVLAEIMQREITATDRQIKENRRRGRRREQRMMKIDLEINFF